MTRQLSLILVSVCATMVCMGSNAQAQPGAATRLLNALEHRLDAIPTTGSEPYQTASPLPDLQPLVGLTLSRIERSLGPTQTCRRQTLDGREYWSPCQTANGRYYSFYRLPAGWVGGGPELVLELRGRTVLRAHWIRTR